MSSSGMRRTLLLKNLKIKITIQLTSRRSWGKRYFSM